MDKPIMLSIQGTQTENGQVFFETQLVTAGRLSMTPGGARLSYEESGEGNDRSYTTIDLNDGIVNLQVSGGPTLGAFGLPGADRLPKPSLALAKHRFSKSVFQTALGRMEMDVFPTDVNYTVNENGGAIRLEYQLSMQGVSVGMNKLDISFWPEGAL